MHTQTPPLPYIKIKLILYYLTEGILKQLNKYYTRYDVKFHLTQQRVHQSISMCQSFLCFFLLCLALSNHLGKEPSCINEIG